ncbi:FAD-dependent oxidoreductase [Candidatus Bathyarchaeota archaeon]|nr:FAD-dependent oxidoreductase [Candidatus Bathyarchaeota archaeon]
MAPSHGVIMEPEKEIPVLREVDILVIGGSQSGVAAAACARRANKNASVLIVEQNGYLGGQSVSGLVVHYEFREHTNNKGQVIAKGIGKEIIERVVSKGHSDPLFQEWLDGKGPPFKNVPDGRAHGDIPLDVNDIKLALLELCEETGVEILLHAKAVAALPLEESSGFPASRGVFVETINGRFAIKARVIIDCSANADVAWWVGGPDAVHVPGVNVMSMQAYAWIENVDLEAFVDGVWKQKSFQVLYPNDEKQMRDHVHQGKTIITRGWTRTLDEVYDHEPELIDTYDELGTIPQIYFWLKTVKTTRVDCDGKMKYIGTFAIEGPQFRDSQVDPLAVTRAEINQLKGVHLQARMHRYLPGWENARLDRTVSRIGFRQTRIPRGIYKLTKDDVIGHGRFDDVIGRGSGHDIGRGNPEAEFGYDIPYRILVPEAIDGLLFGARCVSVEDETTDDMLTALNAHRGISTSMIVSQAAGVAAALCIKTGIEPRQVNIGLLQEELRKQDVILDPPS